MQAYGQALGATSTADAPWSIVPADDKDYAPLIVSKIVLDALAGLKLSYHLATLGLAALARQASIYKDEKFSDHAPLTIAYDTTL